MPDRVSASPAQRAFFESLASVPLALSAKPCTNAWAVNLHGRFVLFEKDWTGKVDKDPRETLLAIAPIDAGRMTEGGEPLIHIHLDWRRIRWAKLTATNRPLIGTDRVLGLFAEQFGPETINFFAKSAALGELLKLEEWIPLSP